MFQGIAFIDLVVGWISEYDMHDIVNAGSVVRVYSVYILETLIRNDSVIVRENFIRQEEKNSKGKHVDR